MAEWEPCAADINNTQTEEEWLSSCVCPTVPPPPGGSAFYKPSLIPPSFFFVSLVSASLFFLSFFSFLVSKMLPRTTQATKVRMHRFFLQVHSR